MKRNHLTFSSQFFVAAFLVFIVLLPAGCACVQDKGPASGAADPEDLVICSEPRPEICTMDYQPVCAKMEDGSYKEYSNGCVACSDQEVVGYVEGNCIN